MFRQAYEIFTSNYPLFLNGAKNTILIAVIGTFLGFLLGTVVALIRTKSKQKEPNPLRTVLRWISNFYVEFVRGTPMMVQAVFLYYGLNKYLNWSPIVAGITVVALNTTAYMAEILRAGIQAVPPGQNEAALSLGMKPNQSFIKIIMPQAIRNAFPSMGNEFIANIKDSSVLNAIQVTELYYQGIAYAGRTFLFEQTMLVLLLIYFIITFTASRLMNLIENRINKTKKTRI